MSKPLTVEQVAEHLGVSIETVRRWIRTGRLRAVRIGRAWLIKQAAVEAALKENSSPDALASIERKIQQHVRAIHRLEALKENMSSGAA